MSEQQTKVQPETPPYVAYATFKNTVRNLQHQGRMVDRVDASALSTMSGSSQKLFIGAVRALRLIDSEGTPSESMKEFAAADTDEKWKPLIKSLVEKHYSTQLPVLARGTPQQLRESFGDIPGSTVVPAIRFLIHAAQDAGLSVSHVIEKNKGGAGSRSKRKSTKRIAPVREGGENKSDDDIGSSSIHMALLKKFPEFDPEWDNERQNAWFASYQKLLEMNNGSK